MSPPLTESNGLASASADLGVGMRNGGLAQVCDFARLGKSCIIGRGACVVLAVHIGDNCKEKNGALIYEHARLGNRVFVGPAAVLTKELFARAVNPDGSLKFGSDWEPVGVIVEDGASIGARAVCVAPITVGARAMVSAGVVVTKGAAPFPMVRGVPATHLGWVRRAGVPLKKNGEVFVCPATGQVYEENSGRLQMKEQ